jgi:hypothetical protein
MRWTIPTRNYDGDWREWFAWYPVCLGNRRWIWLERMKRRRRFGREAGGYWEYDSRKRVPQESA